MKEYSFDILVIGGGGAGFMAADTSSDYKNISVCLINKGWAGCTGSTVMAPGAIASYSPLWQTIGDSKEIYIKDTLAGGAYINNEELVHLLADTSPLLINKLENLGCIFQRDESGKKYLLRTDGGHSFPRSVYLEDHTGMEMMKGLMNGARKNGISIHENVMITDLLTAENRICGAIGINTLSCETIYYNCSAIILATGGAGSLYKNTDNPIDLTGDGYALALKAGAILCDMEFVQFYPVGFVNGTSKNGILAGLLYYSRLYNSKGERFMEKYDPQRLEMTTRDFLSQCIVKEVREGNGGPNGGVYLDLTFHPAGFLEKMIPGQFETYKNMGINPYTDRIEVAPTVHFFMGGMKVDSNWCSTIPGLYGAGEVCGGMHGGNRLSQNALAELLVSGYIAGTNAVSYVSSSPVSHNILGNTKDLENQISHYLKNDSGISPSEIKDKIRSIMWTYVGVIRNEESLLTAMSLLSELEHTQIYLASKDRYMNHQLLEALEIPNMILTAKSVIFSALDRKESRAAHYRSDFPNIDNNEYFSNISIQYLNGEFFIKNNKKTLQNGG